jgi:hypothetical protein
MRHVIIDPIAKRYYGEANPKDGGAKGQLDYHTWMVLTGRTEDHTGESWKRIDRHIHENRERLVVFDINAYEWGEQEAVLKNSGYRSMGRA